MAGGPLAQGGRRDGNFFGMAVRQMDQILFDGYYSDAVETQNYEIEEFAGGFDFRTTDATRLDLDILFNDTNQAEKKGGGPPRLVRLNAPLNMATQAYLNRKVPGSTAKLSALRMMPQPERSLTLDFSSLLGALFYTWLLQLLFPVALVPIVYDKEHRLRMMIKMMGMNDNACENTVLFVPH